MELSPEQWREHGQTARIAGREMFWVDTGGEDRPTIVLIHGFPTSSWDWVPIWEPLAKTHRLVAMDLLGFGFSDKPQGHDYRIIEQADLCEALVRHLELDRFDVLAHDYGDTVAQELLARQNEGKGAGHWTSVCFLNGGLFPETHRPRLIQKLLLSPLGPLIGRLMSRSKFDRSFCAVFGPDTQPSPEELAGFWSLMNLNDGSKVFHRLIRYIPDRVEHRERWVGALREATIPIGVINGSLDPISGAHMVARYREVVGDEHFIVELPKVGHYPQVESPDEVLEAYRRFLSGVDDEG